MGDETKPVASKFAGLAGLTLDPEAARRQQATVSSNGKPLASAQSAQAEAAEDEDEEDSDDEDDDPVETLGEIGGALADLAVAAADAPDLDALRQIVAQMGERLSAGMQASAEAVNAAMALAMGSASQEFLTEQTAMMVRQALALAGSLLALLGEQGGKPAAAAKVALGKEGGEQFDTVASAMGHILGDAMRRLENAMENSQRILAEAADEDEDEEEDEASDGSDEEGGSE